MKPFQKYLIQLKKGILSTGKGLSISLSHIKSATKRRKENSIEQSQYFSLKSGLETMQYPYEQIPVPDIGRYRLHNEMDDCIVCDKCVKVCPVNCIEIEPIKAIAEIGKTSDGSPKRLYAAKFDIDMAKCCFCGLCTTVCPTECLTMTKAYDFSEYDVGMMNYHFATLSPEEATQKKLDYEAFALQKKEKQATAEANPNTSSNPVAGFKPRPLVVKKSGSPTEPPLQKDSDSSPTEANG